MDRQVWKKTNDFTVYSKTSHLKWAVKENDMTYQTLPWYNFSDSKSKLPSTALAYEQDEMAEFVPKWQSAESYLIRWEGCWIDFATGPSAYYNGSRGGPPMQAASGEMHLTYVLIALDMLFG